MRRTQRIAVLAVVVATLLALTGNIATGNLPPSWRPWLWLAWPATIVLIIMAVIIEIRGARFEPPSSPHAPFSDREAIDLLASADVGRRMSGVQHLARSSVAENADPQWYVNVICQYLRRPYTPSVAPVGEREVRIGLLDLLRDRLQEGAVPSWSQCDIDLSGATLDAGSLDGAVLLRSTLRLNDCRFPGSGFSWKAGLFVGGHVDCSPLELRVGETLSLAGSRFIESRIGLRSLVLSGGVLDLDRAQTTESQFDLAETAAESGVISVKDARIGRWTTGDRAAQVAGRSGSAVNFRDAALRGGAISFARTHFVADEEGTIGWDAVGFVGSLLAATEVSFEDTLFSSCAVDFHNATLDGSTVGFRRAKLRESKVSFVEATIKKGAIDFQTSSLWSTVPLDRDQRPVFIVDLESKTPDRLRTTEYWQAGIPYPTVSFAVAKLYGGSILFEAVETVGGTVVDFNHITLRGTTVRFKGGDWSDSVVVLWHLYFEAGSGSVTGEYCSPFVLVSCNMTPAERRRIDLRPALEIAISDTH